MLYYIKNGWEISLDFRQWLIGFNYIDLEGDSGKTLNIFLGPIRLGWWEGAEKFWEGK